MPRKHALKSRHRKRKKKSTKRKHSPPKPPPVDHSPPQAPIANEQEKQTTHSEPQQKKETRKRKRQSRRYVKFVAVFFESAFQIVTWVFIGISIAAFFYFASKDHPTGMALSVIALAVSVIIMVALIVKRVKVVDPITVSPKSITLVGSGVHQEITIHNTTETTLYQIDVAFRIESSQVTNSDLHLDLPVTDSYLLGTETDGIIIGKDFVLNFDNKLTSIKLARLTPNQILTVKMVATYNRLSPLEEHRVLINISGYSTEPSPVIRFVR